jgi:hypothetical protein
MDPIHPMESMTSAEEWQRQMVGPWNPYFGHPVPYHHGFHHHGHHHPAPWIFPFVPWPWWWGWGMGGYSGWREPGDGYGGY